LGSYNERNPMPVNFEVKGMLAKLLATEDLVVEHKKVDTACFNVHTRVLTLPMWERASNTVYDMLVAHEVSHALYTPNEDWSEQVKVPQMFVNVVEDARVEKLMKRRYMGLAKTFYGAYKELHEDDFFMVGDDDVSTYNLADRVNLYYKVGNFIPLSFNPEEQEIVDMIGDAETFGDALIAAEVLYKYCVKEEEQKESQVPQFDNHENSQPGNQSQSQEEQLELGDDGEENGKKDEETPTNKKDEPTEGEKVEETPVDNSGGKTADPDVKTMSSLENSIKNLVNQNSIRENVYLEIPQVNLDSVIISNEKIHKLCSDAWSTYPTEEGVFVEVDKKYFNFKISAQKEVNYLVKEFECRKAADSYARASVSKTGVLDCTKLHTYKYNEDLFRKVTTLANGKNHGLVFILDWSGSMSNVMMDTIKQLYNLIWFCRKVSIPFEVYAFTNNYNPVIEHGDDGYALPPKEHTAKKENQFVVDYSFGLMNLFTSKVRNSVLDEQMKNVFRIVNYWAKQSYCLYSIPPKLQLSGTPLNEALITLHQILPLFQKEHKLQKVQCVVLTDGEAGQLNYYREVRRNYGDHNQVYMGTSYVGDNCYLRDRQTGNVYKINNNGISSFTDLLLLNLRDKFPTVNFIGMRILEGHNVNYFIRAYTGYYGKEYDEAIKRWKKEKSFALTSSGYHIYFGLSANALNTNTEFEVEEDATKAKIKSAFAKSLSAKKMNKRILGEFVELVA
jgi:hypothetical protein